MNGIAVYRDSRILLFCMGKVSCYFFILLVDVGFVRASRYATGNQQGHTKCHETPSPPAPLHVADAGTQSHGANWNPIYTKVSRLVAPREFFKEHPTRPNFRQTPSRGVARGLAKSFRGLLCSQASKSPGLKEIIKNRDNKGIKKSPYFRAFSNSLITILSALMRAYLLSTDSRICHGA